MRSLKFKTIRSLLIVASLIASGIVWARSSDSCVGEEGLSAYSVFQNPESKEPFRKGGSLFYIGLDIANYVYGDDKHDIGPLPVSRLKDVLTTPKYGLVPALDELKFSSVTVIDESDNRVNIEDKSLVEQDEAVLVRYTQPGSDPGYLLQIAMKGSAFSKRFAGSEISQGLSEKYVIYVASEEEFLKSGMPVTDITPAMESLRSRAIAMLAATFFFSPMQAYDMSPAEPWLSGEANGSFCRIDAAQEDSGRRARELFALTDGVVNDRKTAFVKDVNTLTEFLSKNPALKDSIAGESVSPIYESMTMAEIRSRVGGLCRVIKSTATKTSLPAGVAEAAFSLEKRLVRVEADSVVATLIALSRKAKLEGQKFIIGIETDWVPGHKERGAGTQHDAINLLMKEIRSLNKELYKFGLDNVIILHKKSADLAGAVMDIKEVRSGEIKLSNIIIFGSERTVRSGAFASLRKFDGKDGAFFAGVDPTRIEVCAAACKRTEVTVLPDIELMDMLCLALEVAAGKEPPKNLCKLFDKCQKLLVYSPKGILVRWRDYQTTCDESALALGAN